MKGKILIAVLILLSLIVILLNYSPDLISGAFSVVDIAPDGFEFFEDEEYSLDDARVSLVKAQDDIFIMDENDFSLTYAKDALFEANVSFTDGDYKNSVKLSSLVSYVKDISFLFNDSLDVLIVKKNDLQEKGSDVSSLSLKIDQMRDAFFNERYGEAQLFNDEAVEIINQINLENERERGLVRLSRNFLLRNWWQILIVVVVLVLVSIPSYKKIRKKLIQNKIDRLKSEKDKFKQMIKLLQKECFVDKKISVDTYKIKSNNYEQRITQIKHTLPVLEAQLKGVKFVAKKKKKVGVIEIKR